MTIGERIQTFGPCALRVPHEAHVDFEGFYNNLGERVMASCPGQYSDCANCDDRECMACVFREWHDACERSCPECCKEEA